MGNKSLKPRPYERCCIRCRYLIHWHEGTGDCQLDGLRYSVYYGCEDFEEAKKRYLYPEEVPQ